MSLVRLPAGHLAAKRCLQPGSRALEINALPRHIAQMQERRIARSQDEICLTSAVQRNAFALRVLRVRVQCTSLGVLALGRTCKDPARVGTKFSALWSTGAAPNTFSQETAEEKLRLLEVSDRDEAALSFSLSMAQRPTAKDSNWRTSDSSASFQQDE